MKMLVLIAAIAAALVAAPYAMADEKAAPSNGKPSATKSAANAKSDKQRLMKSLRKIVVDSLKDPASANFKDEFLSLSDDKESKTVSLCGYVNAKNSMGGYSGFSAFVVNTEGVLSMESSDTPSVREYLWPVWCSRPI